MKELNVINKNIEPLVSVICVTYNQEAYVRECIEGFLMQSTDFPYEILIHDDASTDRTLDIVKKYQQQFPGLIRVFEEETNQYLKVDFTKLLMHEAKGEYIAFCEGDDYWVDPFKLQRQIDLFRKDPNLTYCFSNRIVKNEYENSIREYKWGNRIYTKEDFLSGFNPGIQTAMCRKDSVTDEDLDIGRENHINGDRTVPISSTSRGYALCVQYSTAVYRVTGKGVSTSLSKNYTAKQWFNHAIQDLYNMHETYGFPSRKAYIKSITAYTFNYMRKTGNIIYGISKSGHYGKTSRTLMILLVCLAEIRYSLGRVGFYLMLLFKKLTCKLNGLFISHQFSSLLYEAGPNSIFELDNAKLIKSFRTPHVNIGNKAVTIADAFVYATSNSMSLYYELQSSFHAKGVLMETTTKDGLIWSTPTIALEEDCHLSFPNVFDMDGKTWMLPETFMKRQVRLYRKEASSNKFILDSVLVEGGKFVDSFICKKDGVYYLFTSLQYDDNSYDLKLYYSEEMCGNYIEHPSSPISHGKAFQRNAGSMINVNNKLFRPAQECSAFYGQNVHIMEVQELSKDVYREVPYMLDIIPQAKGFGIGGHQFSTCVFKGKRIVAIDILHKSINTHILFTRLLKKIGKR